MAVVNKPSQEQADAEEVMRLMMERKPVTDPALICRVHQRAEQARREIVEKHGGKRALIAGPTVSDHEAENWRAASLAGLDAILTGFPLELRMIPVRSAEAGRTVPGSGHE
jgi:hypothetical protein